MTISRLTLQEAEHDLYAVHFSYAGKFFPNRRIKGFFELDDEQAFDRAKIIQDLIDGQFDDCDAVYCNGRDVSREIAEEIVATLVNSGGHIPDHLFNFIQEHNGVHATNDAIREYPFLTAAE